MRPRECAADVLSVGPVFGVQVVIVFSSVSPYDMSFLLPADNVWCPVWSVLRVVSVSVLPQRYHTKVNLLQDFVRLIRYDNLRRQVPRPLPPATVPVAPWALPAKGGVLPKLNRWGVTTKYVNRKYGHTKR